MRSVLVLFSLAVCLASIYVVLGMQGTEIPQMSAAEAQYDELAKKFKAYHTDKLNIAIHFVTTPLGIIAAYSMVNKACKTSVITTLLTIVYCVSLADKIPPQLLLFTSLAMAGIVNLAQNTMHLSWLLHGAMLALGYFGQEFSHYVTGEKTFQSTYQEQKDFLALLAEHTYYLIPLVFDSAMPNHMDRVSGFETKGWMQDWMIRVYHLLPFMAVLVMNFVSKDGAMSFPWQFQRSRVLRCKLTSKQDVADLEFIRAWTMRQNPSKHTSSHWWHTAPNKETPPEKCLPTETRDAFNRIAKCDTIAKMFHERFAEGWNLDVLNGMNEVYVSAPTTVKKTSDEVFYTRHIDGPYYYVPFASCFRMIIGMDANEEITTIFDMVPTECAAQKGDVLAFDFHRECHYIRKNEGVENKDFRIVLKVHYCIYPKWALPFGLLLGWLSTNYNKAFRALFLFTISPKTAFEHFSAWNVVFWTKVVYYLEACFGYSNIMYLIVLAALGWNIDYRIFLVGTSFVHYLRYINTYYHRVGCAYNIFKRDVLIFKTLAVSQIVFWYAHSITKGFTNFAVEVDVAGLAMIAVGYAMSVYCTMLLGVDGTYFGIELGYVKASKNYVQKFPYGVIPHPMILFQVLALLGFHKNEAFRSAMPYLIPAHVCLYLIHMIQEHFDIHANRAAPKRKVA